MLLNDLTPDALKNILDVLQAHPDYRVIQRQVRQDEYSTADAKSVIRKAIILDTETTGMTPTDKIIELGMILFEYDAVTGQVYRVLERFNELEDPGMPIPAEATRVNGITDEMVRGRRIDDNEVNRIAMDVDLVIAHNSGYDRSYVEQRWPIFAGKAWGCSLKQVPWALEGYGAAKLDYIALLQGFFYDAHRAISDCEATLKALQTPLPVTGKLGLLYIIEQYQSVETNVAAIGAPFGAKDTLKARRVKLADDTERRYNWNGDEKCWHIDLPGELVEAELGWLRESVYPSGKTFGVSLRKYDAFSRYSSRQPESERRYVNPQ